METVATERIGIKGLEKALDLPPVVPRITVEYPREIEEAISRISEIIPNLSIEKRGAALMILADAEEAATALGDKVDAAGADEARRIAAETQAKFSNPLAYIIGVSRSKVVDGLLDAVYVKSAVAEGSGAQRLVRSRSLAAAAVLAAASAVLYPMAGKTALAEWGLHPLLLHLAGLIVFLSIVPVKTRREDHDALHLRRRVSRRDSVSHVPLRRCVRRRSARRSHRERGLQPVHRAAAVRLARAVGPVPVCE